MRSRSTPPRPTAPGQPHQPGAVTERAGRRTRATRATPSSNARSSTPRRAQRTLDLGRDPEADPTPDLPPEILAALAPEELYRREKARRAVPAEDTVMAEARRILQEQMAESGKKRGVTITPRGRPPKPKPKPDDWDLEEFGEAQVLGAGTRGGSQEADGE